MGFSGGHSRNRLGILDEFVVSIVHTETSRVIRIISLRKATKHEQAIFFKNI